MSQRTITVLLLLIGISPFLINGYINSIIYTNPLLFWSFELLTWVALPLAILFLLVRNTHLSLDEIGFRWTIFHRGRIEEAIFIGVIFSPISYLLYSSFLSVGRDLFPGGAYFYYQSIVPENNPERALVAIYLALSAALVEGFYYTGLIYRISRFSKYWVVIYLLLSPFLFALAHWEGGLSNVFATYFYGLLSAILFIWMRNIWPLVMAHLFTDFMYFG